MAVCGAKLLENEDIRTANMVVMVPLYGKDGVELDRGVTIQKTPAITSMVLVELEFAIDGKESRGLKISVPMWESRRLFSIHWIESIQMAITSRTMYDSLPKSSKQEIAPLHS